MLYILYWAREVKVYIIQPILQLRINTSDYECSLTMKQTVWILGYFEVILIPFAF